MDYQEVWLNSIQLEGPVFSIRENIRIPAPKPYDTTPSYAPKSLVENLLLVGFGLRNNMEVALGLHSRRPEQMTLRPFP